MNTSLAYFGFVMYEEGISDKSACASNVPLVEERASRGCYERLRYSFIGCTYMYLSDNAHKAQGELFAWRISQLD